MGGTQVKPAPARAHAPPERAAAEPAIHNGAAATGAARARAMAYQSLVPAAWHQLSGDLFSGSESLESAPEIPAFRTGAYRLLADQHHRVEPLIAMLGVSDDRAPYLEALREVAAAEQRDRVTVERISTEVDDLSRGGDIKFCTRHIITAYARLSEPGRAWLPTSPVVAALRRYAAGECERHGQLMAVSQGGPNPFESDDMIGAVERHLEESGNRRVAAVEQLAAMLTGGGFGIGPEAVTPAGDAPRPEDPARSEAHQETAAQLAAKIRRELDEAKRRRGVASMSEENLTILVAELEAAEPEVRDLVYADAALIGELMQRLDASQVQELVGAVDTVEALYKACTGAAPPIGQRLGGPTTPPPREPFMLIRDYLLARPGDDQRPARMRVLSHERLKTEQIDRMAAGDKQAVYRLVARGTLEPTAVDRVLDSVKAGDPEAAASALVQLSAADPAQLAALREDQLFRTEIEKLDREVEINGLPVNPYHLCLTMWGLRPHSTEDPGGIARQTERNPDGDGRPITIEERIQLDDELFTPTVKALRDELDDNIVYDDVMVGILRRFEKKAAKEPYLGWLRREGTAPGPTLANKYNEHYSSSLRGQVQEYTDGNERRECERILGFRVDASTVGTVGGETRLASDEDKGPISLEQAMRETVHGDTPLSQHTHKAAKSILDNLVELPAMTLAGPSHHRFANKGPILDRWRWYSGLIDLKKGELAKLTGMPESRIHAIELLSNAFQEKGGDLGQRIQRCFGRNEKDAAEVLATMGLRPEDARARAAEAEARAMAENPTEAIAARSNDLFAEPAAAIFESIATLEAGDDLAGVAELGAALRAARAKGVDVPAEHARIGETPTASIEGRETSFDGYYRKHYGIDPDRHIARVLGARAARGVDVSVAASTLGVEIGGADAAPAGDELVIDERNRHLVRSSFTAETAREAAATMWKVLHGSGKAQVVMKLITEFGDEEQRLIRMAFRELSGGIDVQFYIQQELLVRKKRGNVLGGQQVEVVGGEGTEAGRKLTGGDTEIELSGDQSQLETALTASVEGELDIHAMLNAAVANADVNYMFELCDEASEDDCREILADKPLMARMQQVCDEYAWDRCYKTLTGQSDLADRLYSRAHGAYDSWNPFDSTDEAGIRRDIKAYVKRLRRKFDAELREKAKTDPSLHDPQVIKERVAQMVREASHQLMVNPDVRSLIEAELSGDELAEVEGMILGAGEASAEADIARGGKSADSIISSIRAMSPARRAEKRADPLYLEKLASRLPDPNDYRAAMDALMSESTGDDKLGELDDAVSEISDFGFVAADGDKAFRALIDLDQSELERLARDPALAARVLAAIDDREKQKIARDLLARRAEAPDPEDPEAVDRSRLEFLEDSAVARIDAAGQLGWDSMLAQCVEVYQMDFEPRGEAPKGEGEPDGKDAAAAAHSRKRVWRRVRPGVDRFARRASRESRDTRSEIRSASEMTAMIRAAVLGEKDPSSERIRENLGGDYEWRDPYGEVRQGKHDNDVSGLKATINAASPAVLIGEWSSVLHPKAGGGESMRDAYRGYREAREATEKAPASDGEDAQAAMEAGALELRRARLGFINYVIDVSQPFEDLLLPHVGSDDSAVSETRERDNKSYNELRELARTRLQTLTKEHGPQVAEAIGLEDEDRGLVDNQNRETLTAAAFRESRFLQSRGEQAGSGWAAHDEAERVDQLSARYQRDVVEAQLNAEGGYGMITGREGADLEEKGEQFDAALKAFKEAKTKVAFWMSLIVGVLATALVTVLTGGLATSAAGMLFWSTVSAGVSAGAKALVNEAVLDVDYDLADEGVKMIGREMLTAFVTAGTTFMAQKMIAGVSGATTLARQARSAEQVMRTPPPMWRSFLNEASEEVLSETMSGTVDAALEAIDPVHWMHGVTEGAARALPAARAKLDEVPAQALKAGFTSMAMAGTTRLFGSKKAELSAAMGDAKRVDIKKNFAEVFGDNREAAIAMFTEWAVDKLGGEDIDLEDVPAELIQGFLEEKNEASIEMHTKTAHAGDRSRRMQRDLKKHEHLLTRAELDDFKQMQSGASDTDPYVSVGDYHRVRQAMIADALLGWAESGGGKLSQAQAHAFSRWVREAEGPDEFQKRLLTDPLTVAEVQSARGEAGDFAQTSDQESNVMRAGESVTPGDISVGTTIGGVQIVARPASVDDGHALMRRLAAGDATAMAELGGDHEGRSDQVEWGLGVIDGQAVVLRGAEGEVDFDQLPGVTALAHTHPAELRGQRRDLEGAAEGGGVAIDALLTSGKHADKVMFLPSQGDLGYLAENNLGQHTVYTPYVHLGDGMVGNPDPKAPPEKRISIDIVGAHVVGRSMLRPDQPAFGATMIIRDGLGNVLHEGPLYQFFFPGLGDQPSLTTEFIEVGVAPLPRTADGDREVETDREKTRAGQENDGQLPRVPTSSPNAKTLQMETVEVREDELAGRDQPEPTEKDAPPEGDRTAEAAALKARVAANRAHLAELAAEVAAHRARETKAAIEPERTPARERDHWRAEDVLESDIVDKYSAVGAKNDDEYAAALEKVRSVRADPELGPIVADIADHELVALYLYTDYHFRRWNNALRSGDPDELAEYGKAIKAADSALAALPDHVGWVERGAGSLPDEVMAQYTVGAVVTEEAFTSTSTSAGDDGAFLGGEVAFKILSKTGKEISGLAKRGDKENEVLFRPGTRFKVVDKIVDGHTTVITMEEVEAEAAVGLETDAETTAPTEGGPSLATLTSLTMLDTAVAERDQLDPDTDAARIAELDGHIRRLLAGLGLESGTLSDEAKRALLERLAPSTLEHLVERARPEDREAIRETTKVEPQGDSEPLTEAELALVGDLEQQVEALARENVSDEDSAKEKRQDLEAELAALLDRLGLAEMKPARREGFLSRLTRQARNYVVVRLDRRRRQAAHKEAGHHPRVELHNHFMGIASPDVFVSRVQAHEGSKPENQGKSGWELTLDAISRLEGLAHGTREDGSFRRGVSGDAMVIVRRAQSDIGTIRTTAEKDGRGLNDAEKEKIQELAEEAVRKALVASEETDFNSAYEVRDELIKQYFGKKPREPGDEGELRPDLSLVKDSELDMVRSAAIRAGKSPEDLTAYADYAREAIAVLVAEGQSYTEQSQSLNKLLRAFPEPMLERLIAEAVEPKLKQIEEDLAAGRISGEEAANRRDAARLVFRNLAMIPTAELAPTDARGKREFTEKTGKDDLRPTLEPEEREHLEEEDKALREKMALEEPVTEPEGLREHGEAFIREQEALGLFEQALRGDASGVDIAGLEEFMFTAAGKARFRALYRRLAAEEKHIVLRPHVGEGSLDLSDPSKGHGIENAARQGERRGDEGEGPTAKELAHYDRARHNLDAIIESLEVLHAMGDLDPSLVEVRFGHATHATPDQIARLKALGVIAEVNLHSNIRTHSLDPTDPRTGELEVERFDDHALFSMIYYQADLVLSTDAHSVMDTSLAEEYAKAHHLIERFLHGELPLRLRPEDAGDRGEEVTIGAGTNTETKVRELYVSDLTSEELDRFLTAYETIVSFAEGYRERAIERTPGKRQRLP